MSTFRLMLAGAAAAGGLALAGAPQAAALHGAQASHRLQLKPCAVAGVKETLRCGVYEVWENRKAGRGRKLPLKVVLLPSRTSHPTEPPVVFFGGGPGETNTDFARDVLESGFRRDHDILLIDSRGTGEGNRLACRLAGADADLQSYLRSPFNPQTARACRRELEGRADLSQYSTPATSDDIDEVRQALGYDQLNLVGGSFGTYAALMYMRAYPRHVRGAFLASLVTFDNRVPLYHAASAQWALDRLFEQCEADSACHGAYPRFRQDFADVQARLKQGPVKVAIRHPATGAQTSVELTEEGFADAVRVTMYNGAGGRRIPWLIARARAGDFSPLAETAVRASRGFYAGVPLGLYYAITCNEFVSRIRPEEVEPATRGSYAGAWRLQGQMASCADWPRTELPPGFIGPYRSDIPTLLVSGDTDPATPPRWGELVHSYLPNSIHLVVPGGHVPVSPCTDAIAEQVFATGQVKTLDTSCVARLQPAPFQLPGAAS
jgi:pimeloyl-ACP methyl ester carboxylesterase